MRRVVLAGAAVGVVALGAVSVAALSGSGGAAGATATDAAVSTATLTRRDLDSDRRGRLRWCCGFDDGHANRSSMAAKSRRTHRPK